MPTAATSIHDMSGQTWTIRYRRPHNSTVCPGLGRRFTGHTRRELGPWVAIRAAAPIVDRVASFGRFVLLIDTNLAHAWGMRKLYFTHSGDRLSGAVGGCVVGVAGLAACPLASLLGADGVDPSQVLTARGGHRVVLVYFTKSANCFSASGVSM